MNNFLATSVFVFICSILLRLRFYLKNVKANSLLFVNFQVYRLIHFRFVSTHQLMIPIDFFSLLNTSSCLFFFLRRKRDALNMTLYRFIMRSFKVFNFYRKSWKFIPFTHDHTLHLFVV